MSRHARITIIKDLDNIELLEADFSRPKFARHAHPTYALGVICGGVNYFHYRHAFHAAPTGSICTVIPDEVHEVEPYENKGFAYRCLYPSAALLRETAESAQRKRLDGTLVLPPVISDPETARLVHILFDTEQSEAPALYHEAAFLSLLWRVVTRHILNDSATDTQRKPPLRSISNARDYLAAHFAENVSLRWLAEEVGLDAFALSRGFVKAYGLPPHAWVLQERVRQAQSRIRLGEAIADVAAGVGFSDQSHLTRCFKRVLGVTPGCYQRAVVKDKEVFQISGEHERDSLKDSNEQTEETF